MGATSACVVTFADVRSGQRAFADLKQRVHEDTFHVERAALIQRNARGHLVVKLLARWNVGKAFAVGGWLAAAALYQVRPDLHVALLSTLLSLMPGWMSGPLAPVFRRSVLDDIALTALFCLAGAAVFALLSLVSRAFALLRRGKRPLPRRTVLGSALVGVAVFGVFGPLQDLLDRISRELVSVLTAPGWNALLDVIALPVLFGAYYALARLLDRGEEAAEARRPLRINSRLRAIVPRLLSGLRLGATIAIALGLVWGLLQVSPFARGLTVGAITAPVRAAYRAAHTYLTTHFSSFTAPVLVDTIGSPGASALIGLVIGLAGTRRRGIGVRLLAGWSGVVYGYYVGYALIVTGAGLYLATYAVGGVIDSWLMHVPLVDRFPTAGWVLAVLTFGLLAAGAGVLVARGYHPSSKYAAGREAALDHADSRAVLASLPAPSWPIRPIVAGALVGVSVPVVVGIFACWHQAGLLLARALVPRLSAGAISAFSAIIPDVALAALAVSVIMLLVGSPIVVLILVGAPVAIWAVARSRSSRAAGVVAGCLSAPAFAGLVVLVCLIFFGLVVLPFVIPGELVKLGIQALGRILVALATPLNGIELAALVALGAVAGMSMAVVARVADRRGMLQALGEIETRLPARPVIVAAFVDENQVAAFTRWVAQVPGAVLVSPVPAG